MKFTAIIFLLCCALSAKSQVQLPLLPSDFANVVNLSELYATQGQLTKDNIPSAERLRSPVLNKIIDIMISSAKGDSTILKREYQVRPAHNELMLWYAINQVNDNRHDTTATKKPAADIVKNVLSQVVSDKILLDCYYKFQLNGLALYFNEADLSHYDVDLNNLGFQNEAEKSHLLLSLH